MRNINKEMNRSKSSNIVAELEEFISSLDEDRARLMYYFVKIVASHALTYDELMEFIDLMEKNAIEKHKKNAND